jgi:hypothetical protein
LKNIAPELVPYRFVITGILFFGAFFFIYAMPMSSRLRWLAAALGIVLVGAIVERARWLDRVPLWVLWSIVLASWICFLVIRRSRK